MKKRFWTAAFLLYMLVSAHAQQMVMLQAKNVPENDSKIANPKNTFVFLAFPQTEELKSISDELIENHFLGNEVANKMVLFKEAYGYQEPVAPGSSATKTIFRKPVISNSVKTIERYLKRKVKSGAIPIDIARIEYNKVLDVVINIINVNTSGFEDRLSSASDTDELLNVYLNEVKLNFMN